MKSETKKNLKNSAIASLMLGVALSFFVFGYAPMEIYFTNKVEFWFDWPMMIRIDLPLFLIATVLITGTLIVAALINKHIYRVLFIAGCIVYFALYIEGTFFSGFLPKTDGRRIDWEALYPHRFISVGIYVLLVAIIVTLILILHYEKTEEILRIGLGGLTLILFVTLITVGIRTNGFAAKRIAAVTKEGEFTLSTKQNVVVILVDAVDASAFENVMERHPEYREDLKDFTYFSNMLSSYTQTNNSVPHMLSGVWDDGSENYLTYRARAFDESPLFTQLESEGYRIGLYEDLIAPESERVYAFDNIKPASSTKRPELKSFVKNQLELVGYRYAPFDLKRFCVIDNVNAEFESVGDEVTGVDNIYNWHNDAFWADVQGAEVTLVDEPCFRWYHVEGGHVPFVYDADMNPVELGSYEMNIAASMTMARGVISLMKDAGVYDNSVIIICADHGWSEDDVVEERNHPVFLVKGLKETHETLTTNDAPVSFEDLQTMFFRLSRGVPAKLCFDWKEGDARDRECYVYYNAPLWTNVKHVQHGHAGDSSTLERVE